MSKLVIPNLPHTYKIMWIKFQKISFLFFSSAEFFCLRFCLQNDFFISEWAAHVRYPKNGRRIKYPSNWQGKKIITRTPIAHIFICRQQSIKLRIVSNCESNWSGEQNLNTHYMRKIMRTQINYIQRYQKNLRFYFQRIVKLVKFIQCKKDCLYNYLNMIQNINIVYNYRIINIVHNRRIYQFKNSVQNWSYNFKQ